MKNTISSAIFSAIIAFSIFSDTTVAENYQQAAKATVSTSHKPSVESVLQTVQQKLQGPALSQEEIFSYFVHLIQHGNESDQPRIYLKSVLKLFSIIIKQYEYANAYAFAEMLEKIPPYIEQHFVTHKYHDYLRRASVLPEADIFDRFKATVYSMLNVKFRTQYELFSKDPESFLSQISDNTTDIAQEEFDIDQTKQLVIRFLEACLSKIIWSPDDQEKTWKITKKISHHLAQLVEQNILTDINDLDDLFWSLTCRYTFFLDITAPMAKCDLYSTIRNDINTKQLLLFDIEEQDAFIPSRKEYMLRSLTLAEARCRAYQQGLITK